jgi:hypothetical protein
MGVGVPEVQSGRDPELLSIPVLCRSVARMQDFVSASLRVGWFAPIQHDNE